MPYGGVSWLWAATVSVDEVWRKVFADDRPASGPWAFATMLALAIGMPKAASGRARRMLPVYRFMYFLRPRVGGLDIVISRSKSWNESSCLD